MWRWLQFDAAHSPATLHKKILRVRPAILLIAPSVNTVDVRRPVKNRISTCQRWCLSPADFPRTHETGSVLESPCTNAVRALLGSWAHETGSVPSSMSQRVKRPRFHVQERPGRHLLPFLTLTGG